MRSTAMKSVTTPSTITASAKPAPPAEPAIARVAQAISASRAPATQMPHVIGYELQQFVRLAGTQCRMSADEVAYHNRAHGRARR
jgi:hypothetical protein